MKQGADALGRVTHVTNPLTPSGQDFTYAYVDETSRLSGVTYPTGTGLSTSYTYFPNTNTQDFERLETIQNFKSSGATSLSKFDYTYSADGKIATWQQQTDSNTPLLWTEGYDADNRLTSAVQTNTAITSPSVRSDSYGYDAVGNATTFNVSGVSRSPSYNSLNQLTGSTPSGNRTVGYTGLLNLAATVTVNGSSATVNSGHYFSGTASLSPGTTTTVPVVATDSSGNVRTNNYQTVVPAEPTYSSPTYDNDGNELTSGAGQTYTWDAKNELMSIVYTAGSNSGNHTEFAYDAIGHRIAIVERTGAIVGSGTVTSTKQLVWNGATVAEERDASNTVTKKFFALGEQIGSSSYYYTKDHLRSVREMTDSTGAIQARYDYDPYGRSRLAQGTLTSDFQYAGYYEHATSGLNLTLFRAYDPITTKWLSRDPIGEHDRINLYGYVHGNPLNAIDPMGLCTLIEVPHDPLTFPIPPLEIKLDSQLSVNLTPEQENELYAAMIVASLELILDPEGADAYMLTLEAIGNDFLGPDSADLNLGPDEVSGPASSPGPTESPGPASSPGPTESPGPASTSFPAGMPLPTGGG